jgi:hypothetical protein
MEQHVEAGCLLPKSTGTVVSGVGSLSHAAIRLANPEYTTAEIVIAVFRDVIYKREFAEESGYEELAVYPAETTQNPLKPKS